MVVISGMFFPRETNPLVARLLESASARDIYFFAFSCLQHEESVPTGSMPAEGTTDDCFPRKQTPNPSRCRRPLSLQEVHVDMPWSLCPILRFARRVRCYYTLVSDATLCSEDLNIILIYPTWREQAPSLELSASISQERMLLRGSSSLLIWAKNRSCKGDRGKTETSQGIGGEGGSMDFAEAVYTVFPAEIRTTASS